MTYAQFAEELLKTGIISDAWLDGKERFQLEPILLAEETYLKLCQAAEAIGKVYHELSLIVWNNPNCLDEFFQLTPFQKLMWLSSGGNWHVIARLDVFITKTGTIQICEMNSDTPSGEAEAVWLNKILQPPTGKDPNISFENEFCSAVFEYYRANAIEIQLEPTVAILYPTDLPEDLSMIELYRRWFEKRNCKVVLGSPLNVTSSQTGRVKVFENEIDIVIRHYKTDWWGERESAWLDGEPYDDSEPLATELQRLIEAEQSKKVAVINPFGATLTQNKLTLAFMWEYLNRFKTENQNAIRAYTPPTYRLSDLQQNALDGDFNQREWVLKSDYGCEGDEVIIGNFVSQPIWNESLAKAKPNRWILQRYFDAAQNDEIINYGIYLIAGKASGIFTRISKQATDYAAKCAAVFLK